MLWPAQFLVTLYSLETPQGSKMNQMLSYTYGSFSKSDVANEILQGPGQVKDMQ